MTPDNDAAPMDPPIDPGSDEALSAYLAGELDAAADAAFAARLAAEPMLAAQLDALAGALMSLADTDPPEGFDDRLHERLAAEAAAGDLAARRRRAAQRWGGIATAAAALAVLAIAGGRMLTPAGDDSAREVALKDGAESLSMEAGAADLSAPDGAARSLAAPADPSGRGADDFAAPPPGDAVARDGTVAGTGPSGDSGGGTSGTSGGSGSADSPAMAAAPAEERQAGGANGPVIADEHAAFTTDDELRAYYQGRPEAEQLRGMTRDEADETATRHAEQVRAAGPFSSGVRPGACLDEVLQMDQGPRIVARAEWIQWQDGGSLAYVLAVSSPGSTVIDAFELWVVQPEGCGLRRHLSWR